MDFLSNLRHDPWEQNYAAMSNSPDTHDIYTLSTHIYHAHSHTTHTLVCRHCAHTHTWCMAHAYLMALCMHTHPRSRLQALHTHILVCRHCAHTHTCLQALRTHTHICRHCTHVHAHTHTLLSAGNAHTHILVCRHCAHTHLSAGTVHVHAHTHTLTLVVLTLD